MLTDEREWDRDAARLILAYRGGSKQVWENSEIDAAWPNLMRESMNAQFFVHGHPDFLAVSATHGLAQFALFSEDACLRFGLNRFGGLQTNRLIQEVPGVSPSDDPQNINGFYGGGNANIVTLQKRGAVFLACHDSIHAIARRVRDLNDDKTAASADGIAAALTNALIPDCVLVPSVVGFLPELEKAGFEYAKGS